MKIRLAAYFSREGLREALQLFSQQESKTMNATGVTQHSLDVPKAAGTDLIRFYKLDGDTPTITTACTASPIDGEEGEFILVWKKVQRES